MQILALFYDSHAVPACSGLSNLGMKESDIQSYMMYMLMVKYITQAMIEEISTQPLFELDRENEISTALLSVCKEVIFIEDNF